MRTNFHNSYPGVTPRSPNVLRIRLNGGDGWAIFRPSSTSTASTPPSAAALRRSCSGCTPNCWPQPQRSRDCCRWSDGVRCRRAAAAAAVAELEERGEGPPRQSVTQQVARPSRRGLSRRCSLFTICRSTSASGASSALGSRFAVKLCFRGLLAVGPTCCSKF